jgi:uncharacterized membrane protein YjjB (DUF3815 family)
MILLMLILGTLTVFSSGVLFNIFLNEQKRSDLFMSIIALCIGFYILISMIGAIV